MLVDKRQVALENLLACCALLCATRDLALAISATCIAAEVHSSTVPLLCNSCRVAPPIQRTSLGHRAVAHGSISFKHVPAKSVSQV